MPHHMDKPHVRERCARMHRLSIEQVNNMTTQEMMDINTTHIYLHAKRNYDAMKKRQRKQRQQNNKT